MSVFWNDHPEKQLTLTNSKMCCNFFISGWPPVSLGRLAVQPAEKTRCQDEPGLDKCGTYVIRLYRIFSASYMCVDKAILNYLIPSMDCYIILSLLVHYSTVLQLWTLCTACKKETFQFHFIVFYLIQIMWLPSFFTVVCQQTLQAPVTMDYVNLENESQPNFETLTILKNIFFLSNWNNVQVHNF